jgi:acyl dehydratase
MAINPNAVGTKSEPGRRSWTSKDALLYALGVGAGTLDPVNQELEFTTENSQGVQQKVLPTMAVVLGVGGNVLSAIGPFNWAMLLHAEQGIELHREIPVEGELESQTELTGIYDKGKGALVVMEAKSKLVGSDEPLFTSRTAVFIRGEGGFGGDRGPAGPQDPPERAPDHSVTYQTRDDQALIYRLSGDRNPLHSDPSFAKRANFPKPILHGLCSYGFTGRALLHTLCGGDPARFKSMEVRFSSPVFPGEALTVEMWVDDNQALFRTKGSDGRVVLTGGRLRFS